MEYPINGLRYSELILRRLIVAKPNMYDEPQAFRIYAITKPINGIVTVNAEHISYDMSGYVVSPFTSYTLANTLQKLVSYCSSDCPFTFWTDKSVSSSFTVEKPTSLRSLLGGSEGSILDIFGKGEYEFDNFSVKLHTNRGENRGVTIRYGKNLTELEQEENSSAMYTGVYPYWYTEDNGLVELTEKIIYADGTYDFEKIYPYDCSSLFESAPTEDELRSAAQSYISNNNLTEPKISITVSFAQLAQSEEYADYALLEQVHLCDTVTVVYADLGVSATVKCITTKYDVITGKYTELELGEASSNLATTLAEHESSYEDIVNTSSMQKAIYNATRLITGGLGGYVIMHSSSDDSDYPDEILIMDEPDILSATKVWRWNKNGLGYSSTGYEEPYGLAMTIDGAIVADYITTGILDGALIKTGSIYSDSLSVEAVESIRLTADKISWESSYSSMTESGILTCTRAVLNNATITTQSGSYTTEIKNGRIYFYTDKDAEDIDDGDPIGYISGGTSVISGTTKRPIRLAAAGGVLLYSGILGIGDYYEPSENGIYSQGQSGSIRLTHDLNITATDTGVAWSYSHSTITFVNGLMVTSIGDGDSSGGSGGGTGTADPTDVSSILNENDWETVSAVSSNGTAANYWSIGDRKEITVSGTIGTLTISRTYSVFILGFDHNSSIEGSGITFGCFTEDISSNLGVALCTNYGSSATDGTLYFNMNHWGNVNYGGWSGCDLRYDILGSTDNAPYDYGTASSEKLGRAPSSSCATNPVTGTLMAALPADLRAVMKPITKYTCNISNNNTLDGVFATTDYLPLLSEFEVFGARIYANSYEQNFQLQYNYYVAGNTIYRYRHDAVGTGTTAVWWLRSPRCSSSTYFCSVSASGTVNYIDASFSYGLSPAFLV